MFDEKKSRGILRLLDSMFKLDEVFVYLKFADCPPEKRERKEKKKERKERKGKKNGGVEEYKAAAN